MRTEWTVLPKAAAITVGGMAGFVLGLRRYGIRKFVYAAAGLTTMAAFCYPYEAIEFSKTGWAHAKRTYEDFQQCKQFYSFQPLILVFQLRSQQRRNDLN